MDLEQLGTAAVIQEVSKTKRLKAFVNSGDKEPSFDGHIYIYKATNYAKDELRRVPVQIKAKGIKSKPNRKIKYPVSIVDLKNYMHNGGVMFFVVYIDKDTGNTKKIYYASLLPFKIGKLIENNKENINTINVHFNQFPADEDEITELFLNHYSNAQKQISFVDKKLPSIEDLMKKGELESLTFSYVSAKGKQEITNYPKILNGKEIYLYANTKDSIVPIPVECHSEISHLQMSCNDNVQVRVNGEMYYSNIGQTITEDKIVFKIGSSLTITLPNTGGTEKEQKELKTVITIKLKGTLKQRITSLEFLSAMLEAKKFEFGDVIIPVEFPKEELKKLATDSYPELLTAYRKALSVLEKLNIKKDIDLDQFNEDDFWKLNVLIGAIDCGLPVKNVEGDLPCIVNFNFGGLHLVMVCRKREDGSYDLWDYFNKHIDVCVYDEDKKPIAASQFSILRSEDFLSIDNLNLQSIIDDYKRIEPQQYIVENGNFLMLEMLKAYDKEPNQELLEAIKQMLEWLQNGKQFLTDEVLLLNKFQVIKRERQLTFIEKQELSNIAINAADITCRIGAFILMEEKIEAEKLLAEMPQEQRKEFMKFPIFYFYKKSKED